MPEARLQRAREVNRGYVYEPPSPALWWCNPERTPCRCGSNWVHEMKRDEATSEVRVADAILLSGITKHPDLVVPPAVVRALRVSAVNYFNPGPMARAERTMK